MIADDELFMEPRKVDPMPELASNAVHLIAPTTHMLQGRKR